MAHAKRTAHLTLASVTPAEDYCLDVTFGDGKSGRVSVKESVFTIPGLAPLRDPAAFARVMLGEYGWEAEWPDFDIQIGPDTLLADMLQQTCPPSDS